MVAVSPHLGRRTRRFRNLKREILAASTVCWLCGHPGSDSLDHVITRADCITNGWYSLLEDPANLRACHHRPCPVCGIRCNRQRGAGKSRAPSHNSRVW